MSGGWIGAGLQAQAGRICRPRDDGLISRKLNVQTRPIHLHQKCLIVVEGWNMHVAEKAASKIPRQINISMHVSLNEGWRNLWKLSIRTVHHLCPKKTNASKNWR